MTHLNAHTYIQGLVGPVCLCLWMDDMILGPLGKQTTNPTVKVLNLLDVTGVACCQNSRLPIVPNQFAVKYLPNFPPDLHGLTFMMLQHLFIVTMMRLIYFLAMGAASFNMHDKWFGFNNINRWASV